MEALRGELQAFYRTASWLNGHTPFYVDLNDAIRASMDRFAQDNPNCPAVLLKARLHEEIAAQCEPVPMRWARSLRDGAATGSHPARSSYSLAPCFFNSWTIRAWPFSLARLIAVNSLPPLRPLA